MDVHTKDSHPSIIASSAAELPKRPLAGAKEATVLIME
jgi:hypothetical protein